MHLMEGNIFFFVTIAILFLAELAYFKLAEKFRIIDKPNERSSHTVPIIRGGGVVFIVGALIWFFTSGLQWPWFMMSVVIIALISFLDDILSMPAIVRFIFQMIAIILVFYQLWPLEWPWYLISLALIFTIGTLNAFNFMDGINGITGVNALVTLITFAYLQETLSFTDINLIIYVSLSVIVFLFFNFRKRARSFAGDVGSVTIALILVFLLLQLITTTNNFLWPVLFLVYGTDSIVTIVHRLSKGENIFKPHRSHLYQFLSNEKRIPHLWVSAGYGVVQGLLNVLFIYLFKGGNYLTVISLALFFIFIYILIRFMIVKELEKPAG